MTNTKISALTSATTPLAGTETLPIVQSSATVKTTVANLTAGRDVSTATLNFTGATVPANGWYLPSANALAVSTNSTEVFRISSNRCVQIGSYSPAALAPLWIYANTSGGGSNDAGTWVRQDGTDPIAMWGGSGGALRAKLMPDGTWTLQSNNLVFGTAAKGINFTANTPAAGMTSQLLNWYEEGTWTPTQGAGLTVVGAFVSAGTYTRIGRQITVIGWVAGATSISAATASPLCGGMPYSALDYCLGTATDNGANNGISLYVSATTLYAANPITSSTARINFGATFFI